MTLTDIIGYLPHGLAAVSEHGTMRLIYETIYIDVLLEGYRPVLRPMSDLSKEITERGYNDGNSFVPIVELANTYYYPYTFPDNSNILETDRYIRLVGIPRVFTWDKVNNKFGLGNTHKDGCIMGVSYTLDNIHNLYDLLHRWHFDYRGLIARGEAVAIGDLQMDIY